MRQVSGGMSQIEDLKRQLQPLHQSHVDHVVFLFHLQDHLEKPLVFVQMQSHLRMPEWSQSIMAVVRTLRR
jgi:hypothetical protein